MTERDSEKVCVVNDETFKHHIARLFSAEWIDGWIIRDVAQNYKGEWIIVATVDRFAKLSTPAVADRP